MTVEIRVPYVHYPHDGQSFKDEKSLTKQSFRDECDFNKILENYEVTGQITHLNVKTPQYGDFTAVADFQQAQNLVTAVRQEFDGLPARIRDFFENSPENMLAFVADPANAEKCKELGLVLGGKTEAVSHAEQTSPSAPAAEVRGAGDSSPAPAPSDGKTPA